ncbi:hypothetical protein A3E97_05440 [Candidatus Uhrbacteria bacterium RIFCSPHIGHO2_12_FULL_47_12]|uniref:Glucose-6-phosphate isomerase n=1 Tax=Candidatus Uhrbacteria bacterium RIFCSPLOWO2_02_FULL_48_18 TaxID=1802408 RepID=A0A1F7V959_9BACT|nr:MAG: hypothetical protein A3E97_05440 [Candidatus Uhrbacteria bacterium RIFCSPHIGHO2_12_FULL_47_12]OGL81877.1 MAG: hypothetical protein A3B20_02185 [Candidatus Uhrbacteria bacterium RIFCSPLOWO2_01_FULL_47_17]OGL87040.1 MAG: hypothetical protein A3I41_03775 [Candidatus Uhrbacteria bacterium RIFCSPLOWO2_02_FULL_48_18]OGL92746.1 MAG: hypothetical protein A3H12_03720 [Candidatus Uhrbacteria bacterium RIFCSPLOWO2_12_FULL_47_9]
MSEIHFSMIISTKNSGISAKELGTSAKQLESYRRHLVNVREKSEFDDLECSINLPFSTHIDAILERAEGYRTKQLKIVVVIGIGGSNLGTQAVYDALPRKNVEMLFLDTVSSTHFSLVLEKLTKQLKNKKQFLIVSISKSGGTTETMANTEALLAALKKLYKDVRDRLVVISDDGSKFFEAAKKQKIDHLGIPAKVGGRYSVFSAVGLFPLAVAGYDVRKLVEGARGAVEDGLLGDTAQNHALVSAYATYAHAKKGRSIHNTFLFAPELESLGKWYRQLMGESVGKEKDLDGHVVHAGITPIVSIGSTDLHSMAQLYFGGPDDKFTNIISIARTPSFMKEGAGGGRVPSKLLFPNMVEHLPGKSLDELMSEIVGGVTATYQKLKRPFLSIELEAVSEKELGYYLQFRMVEMMYLAQLMSVNAFDQPAVEGYKVETKKRLM